MHQHSNYRGPRRIKEESEKIFEMIIVENFPNMGKHIVHQVLRSPESPIEAKPKEKHTKTYTNQTSKD